jgi:hypothetical protein
MIGLGALIHHLGGGSENSADKYYGRKIHRASFDAENDRVILSFEDGVIISIFDNGQSCCESRYMVCEDDLSTLNGKTLRAIEVVEGPDAEMTDKDSDNYHEICFLEIKTNEGPIVTFSTHNEHNGYYGGFGLSIAELN